MLQGHSQTRYQRELRKGEYEILFAKNGIHYRYYWKADTSSGKLGTQYEWVRGHDGGKVAQPVVHPKGLKTEVKEDTLKNYPFDQGGYFKMEALVGPIIQVMSRIDETTQTPQSYPNAYETEFICKAVKDDMVPQGGAAPDADLVTITKGQKYRYTLVGDGPETWKVHGPIPVVKRRVDTLEASRRKMTESEIVHVEQKIAASIKDDEVREEVAVTVEDL
jgi:hypothetical protein